MTADAAKPRHRFRFSLRSLILLVALAGSGYGLWYRVYTIHPWVWVKDRTQSGRPALGENLQGVTVTTNYEHEWVAFWSPDHKGKGIRLYAKALGVTRIIEAKMPRTDEIRLLVELNPGDEDGREEPVLVMQYREPPRVIAIGLPEFWLTWAFGLGLVFSLWRDSRIMRA